MQAENDLGFSVSQLVKQSVDDEETKQVLLGMLSGVAEGEQTDAHVEQQASSDEGITQPRGRVQEEEMPHDENDPQLDPASEHLHESEDAETGDTFESSDQEDAFVNALARGGAALAGRSRPAPGSQVECRPSTGRSCTPVGCTEVGIRRH